MIRLTSRTALMLPLGVAALTAATAVAVPAQAAPVGFPVSITAHTDFSTASSQFVSNLPGCTTGTVTNGADSAAHFTPWGGVFVGTKSFSCDGGGGFDISLNAKFGADGSTGTWVFADGTGAYAGIKGSGSLVGIPTSIGIDDMYSGTAR
jgi:hypothetical protein